MKTVHIGIVGSGFAARLHAEAYAHVSGVCPVLHAVASLDPDVGAFAKAYGIANVYPSLEALLKDPAVEIVDIVTPPHLHASMVMEALAAGRHVLCEKPITGAFDTALSPEAMYEYVVAEMDGIDRVAASSGKLFGYAENFIYAPAIEKTVEFLAARRSKILYMRGEEGHCGSHALHAAAWAHSGGGALIRQGCHPLAAVLYLKQKEASIRGERIVPQSVVADMGQTLACLSEAEKQHIQARPIDVEDFATLLLTFSDGTKASVAAGDMLLGGIRNRLEVFTNDGVYESNISPNDHLRTYHPHGAGLESVYMAEKVETKVGWQRIMLNDIITRGYAGELQDFLRCAAYGGTPESGFPLAYETARILYAAYWSAASGARIRLT